jgi:Ca-activated chloride channel family protein
MFVKTGHRAPALTGALAIFAGALTLVNAARVTAATMEEPQVSIQPRVTRATHSDIRVDTNLVLIPVSVTDRENQPVVGLPSDRFRVFEGKTEQRVRQVFREDAPVSVGIVLDTSGSMKRNLPKEREAVVEFLKNANPDDEFFLVSFNNTSELAVPFTADSDVIQSRLNNLGEYKGKTALLDATYLALHHMKDARNPRKALLVISDGGDNHSRYSEAEIRRFVRESDVWIYAIGIYAEGPQMLPEEERGGEKLLTDIAEETGGRQFPVYDARELPALAAKIGLQLRNQYVLAYSPVKTEDDGKYRRVQVKLMEGRALRLSWRPGYYAR